MTYRIILSVVIALASTSSVLAQVDAQQPGSDKLKLNATSSIDVLQQATREPLERLDRKLLLAKKQATAPLVAALKDFETQIKRNLDPRAQKLQVALHSMLAECQKGSLPSIRVTGTIALNNHDYGHVMRKQSWHVAEQECRAMGGHLVTLETREEASLLDSLFRKTNADLWLGATDEAQERDWRWVTGERMNFSAVINEDNGLSHYLSVTNRWGYNDHFAGDSFSYVCEWDTLGLPGLIEIGEQASIQEALRSCYTKFESLDRAHRIERFRVVNQAATNFVRDNPGRPELIASLENVYQSHGFITPPLTRETYKDSSYALITDAKTWHEARKHCENCGGQLAVIETPAEAAFVVRQFNPKNLRFWVGASNEDQARTWQWVDGTPVKLPFLVANEQRDPYRHHLLYIPSTGTGKHWGAEHASVRISFLCEWPGD